MNEAGKGSERRKENIRAIWDRWPDLSEKEEITYDSEAYDRCSQCNGANELSNLDAVEGHIMSVNTKCTECGWKDYWMRFVGWISEES